MKTKEHPYKTGLTCPITGKQLMYVGSEVPYILDGYSYYEPENNVEKIRYRKHPRSYLYEEISSRRYFKPSEDGAWVEYIKIKGLDGLFPIDITKKEISRERKTQQEEKRKRKAEYKAWWNSLTKKEQQEEIRRRPKRVFATTVNIENVEVCPMKPPTNELFYMDFKYKKS